MNLKLRQPTPSQRGFRRPCSRSKTDSPEAGPCGTLCVSSGYEYGPASGSAFWGEQRGRHDQDLGGCSSATSSPGNPSVAYLYRTLEVWGIGDDDVGLIQSTKAPWIVHKAPKDPPAGEKCVGDGSKPTSFIMDQTPSEATEGMPIPSARRPFATSKKGSPEGGLCDKL